MHKLSVDIRHGGGDSARSSTFLFTYEAASSPPVSQTGTVAEEIPKRGSGITLPYARLLTAPGLLLLLPPLCFVARAS